jgi:hypothetical protein
MHILTANRNVAVTTALRPNFLREAAVAAQLSPELLVHNWPVVYRKTRPIMRPAALQRVSSQKRNFRSRIARLRHRQLP